MENPSDKLPQQTPTDIQSLLQDQELRDAITDFFALGGEYKDVVNMSDEQIESVYALALQFYDADRYDKAGPLCQLICLLDSRQIRYWRALGAVRQMQGETEASINAYAMALMLEPENPSVLIDMGNCLLAAGDLDRARECYDGALTIGQGQEDYTPVCDQARQRLQLIDAVGELASTSS